MAASIKKTHSVEIPEGWLVLLAAHGKMGSGDVPRLMQQWAGNQCRVLGIEDKMLEMKAEYTSELRQRLANTLGSDAMSKVDSLISKTLKQQ